MADPRTRLADLPRRRPLASLALAVLASEVVGAAGAVFTVGGLESWYGTLVQPALAPPNWVFGPVWTTLFALMGAAAWLVWRELDGPNDGRRPGGALAWFAGQFVLNVAWSAAFFGARSIVAGLVVIAALWLAIVGTVRAFDRVDRRAAALLLPYLAWVSFAGYLNYAFWTLN
ncbi:MAG: TspO/MBR family protein [Halobacteriales archaeon]|nr:TspO/MBR family protein [Halobacteriales archaeon]